MNDLYPGQPRDGKVVSIFPMKTMQMSRATPPWAMEYSADLGKTTKEWQ